MRHVVASLVVCAIAGTLAGCTPAPPTETPSLRGVVTSVDSGTEGMLSLRVVWDESLGERLELDAAQIGITEDTRVFEQAEGSDSEPIEIAAADIEVRDVVDVWITGPVLESYPVQATASDVAIVGRLARDRPLPTPKGLEPPSETPTP